MCSPSRATLLTGLLPGPARRDRSPSPHADLRPDPRNTPAVTATLAEILRTPGAPRDGGRCARSRAGAAPARTRVGQRARAPARRLPNLAQLLRAAGYEVAYKGKWHLTHPLGRRALLGGWAPPTPSGSSATTASPTGSPPTPGENAKAENFGGGNAGRGRGLGRGLHAPGRALARPRRPAGAVLPRRLAGQPPRRARLPGLRTCAAATRATEFRDLGVGLPPTLDEDLRDKPSVHSLMRMGMTAYLGPLERRAGEARLRQLLRPPAPGRRREDRPAAGRARRPGRPALAALAHGDRPLLRPRRDGPLARRPAPEGVQRLRGDDPRPAGRLEPGPVPASRPRPTRSPRWSTCCRRSPRSPGPSRPAGRSAVATSRRCWPSTPRPSASALRRGRGRPRAARRAPRPAPTRSRTRSTSPTTTTRRPPRWPRRPGQPNRVRCVRTARAQVRGLPRSRGQGPGRVRDVRPRARP